MIFHIAGNVVLTRGKFCSRKGRNDNFCSPRTVWTLIHEETRRFSNFESQFAKPGSWQRFWRGPGAILLIILQTKIQELTKSSAQRLYVTLQPTLKITYTVVGVAGCISNSDFSQQQRWENWARIPKNLFTSQPNQPFLYGSLRPKKEYVKSSQLWRGIPQKFSVSLRVFKILWCSLKKIQRVSETFGHVIVLTDQSTIGWQPEKCQISIGEEHRMVER